MVHNLFLQSMIIKKKNVKMQQHKMMRARNHMIKQDCERLDLTHCNPVTGNQL